MPTTVVHEPANEPARPAVPAARPPAAPPVLLRWGIASVFLLYGLAKLLGAQFTILDSELDRPMGQVRGIWLTWYFFGYSPVYGNLIGLAQIAGAALLTFRRTTLLGACLLFPIITNIVLIDLFYGIDLGATIMAIVLWIGLLVILRHYREPLLALFRQAGAETRPSPPLRRAAAWSARVVLVAAGVAFMYWNANHNNRAPTPIDGAWTVASARGAGEAVLPERIYFEYNRAHLVVFRYADHWTAHHFEVEPGSGELRIWAEWLRKGDPVFVGRYRLEEGRLELRGRLEMADADVELDLETLPLARRGRPPVRAAVP